MKMPASFAEFSDALQKARIKDGSFCKNELTCIHYNGLTHAMIGWNANLYDLNLFAQRLASLTEEQKKGMDALLKIKQNHRVAPIPLNQLINLTYNTDICCFAPRVSNHEELGAFLYANEMLSNEAMALLDKANTSTYGNPEITKVNIGVGTRPGILVSGHDLRDLEMLLKQTQGSGVDVYTHSEMLPAHYYPAFKKYPNFVGNYGNAWWKQKEEFERFHGPILMTTNCIVPPKDSYKDRMYTTGAASYPGCTNIPGAVGEEKDVFYLVEMKFYKKQKMHWIVRMCYFG